MIPVISTPGINIVIPDSGDYEGQDLHVSKVSLQGNATPSIAQVTLSFQYKIYKIES